MKKSKKGIEGDEAMPADEPGQTPEPEPKADVVIPAQAHAPETGIEPAAESVSELAAESVSELAAEMISLPPLKVIDEDKKSFTVRFGDEEYRISKDTGTFFIGGGVPGSMSMGLGPRLALRQQLALTLDPGIFQDVEAPREFYAPMIVHEIREQEYMEAGFEDAHARAVHDELLYVMKYFDDALRAQYLAFQKQYRLERCKRDDEEEPEESLGASAISAPAEESAAPVAPEDETPEEKQLSPEQAESLISTLRDRFHTTKHEGLRKLHEHMSWEKIEARLRAAQEENPEKMWSLNEMERTGGEPDVVGYDKETKECTFYDCSAESPVGRRYICYDRLAQEEAEAVSLRPKGNAVDMARAMGITILTEEEYRGLQELGIFDRDSWSWLKTPVALRKTGNALFGNRGGGVVCVFQYGAVNRGSHGAFHGSLRV